MIGGNNVRDENHLKHEGIYNAFILRRLRNGSNLKDFPNVLTFIQIIK